MNRKTQNNRKQKVLKLEKFVEHKKVSKTEFQTSLQDSKTKIFPKDNEEKKKGLYLERKVCMHLFEIWFSSDISTRVGLLIIW